MQPDEWTEYTVDVESGIYTIEAYVAAGNDDPGDLQVHLDGEVIATLEVPPTRSWGRYTTVSQEHVEIAASGTFVLRLAVVEGGAVNYDYVRFAKTGD